MDDRLLGFFSGFPHYRFPRDVAGWLGEAMANRDSLVFVSAWPTDHARNDNESDGMHDMFVESDMAFARHDVIDDRMEAAHAKRLIREASCVFLMGGHPGLQMRLLRDKGLDVAIRETAVPVLGVSAGAINMAMRALDTKESPVPYDGLGLADVTVKPHFTIDNHQVLSTLFTISEELPIYALEDDSAIFVVGDRITYMGHIHWLSKGKICPVPEGYTLMK